MALQVVDRAIQVHGAEGICQDTPLAKFWAGLRTLRFADGPDEVCISFILPYPPPCLSLPIVYLGYMPGRSC